MKKRTLDIGLLRSLAATGSFRNEISVRLGYHATHIAKVAKANDIEILHNWRGYQVDCQDWVPKVEMLLELRDSGMSLAEIASRLGATKSAVAGKLWRMGLCEKRAARHHNSAYWSHRNEELQRLRFEGWTDARIAKHFGIDRRAVNRQRVKLEKESTPTARRGFKFPPYGHCLFPSGDVPHITFCGAKREDIEKPYCNHHHAQCYLPPKPHDKRLAA